MHRSLKQPAAQLRSKSWLLACFGMIIFLPHRHHSKNFPTFDERKNSLGPTLGVHHPNWTLLRSSQRPARFPLTPARFLCLCQALCSMQRKFLPLIRRVEYFSAFLTSLAERRKLSPSSSVLPEDSRKCILLQIIFADRLLENSRI